MVPTQTWRWWTSLRAVSVFNALLWVGLLIGLGVPADHGVPHLICSGIFVAVCGFRSFFPRVDLERTVMLDHPLSGIALGRTSATIAEMSFTVQSALVLEVLGRAHGVSWVGVIAWVVGPLIAVAQTACWTAVVTLNHLWHGVEELLWTLYVLLAGAALIGIWPHATGTTLKGLLVLGLIGCVASAILMSGIDVPMYVKRYREGQAQGERFLGVGEGFRDAAVRREPTQDWAVWRHEVPWMSLYFSGGVWLSLVMAWAPIGRLP